ncbi:argininosuccinate lyase [Microvirga sp. KLBC 81]|uniref:argininosuccinate lyase n=1 Tax=Microvirga sp. KLBC 81 TaxID=1862707 RepID=UPI000D5247AA|nr:argininosuccinate lyase [Microvirga sp. KLBC 81]PVE20765.1 argininosuccinate lyase [Microvirga sp. KLBC 81]
MKNAVSARLSERTAEEVANTIYRPGMQAFSEEAFADMCRLNQAHLVMLSECGLVSHEVATGLAKALLQVQREGKDAVRLDPQFEDPYFAFENRLSEIAGAKLTGWIHIGRSRNDIGATLDRLHARALCLRILEQLGKAREACLMSAEQYAETIMPGYTHLQPAQPITFGYYLTNVAAALQRDYDRIAATYARINLASLGAAALAGTSFAINRQRTAELLGFDGIAEPCLDAVASRDFVTELLWATTAMSTLLSRVAQDLYTFCTHEFSAIEFPDRVAGTSSIMPQKKNPLMLEYFRASSGRSIGALTSVLASVKGSNYSIGLDSVREGIADAWSALDQVVDSLDLLRLVFETAKPNAELLLQRCRTNFSTATDLADGLVRQAGLSFREAHHVVGGAVQMALNEGIGASDITADLVNRSAQAVVGHTLAIDDAFVQACLDPVRAVAARTTSGGTAPSEVLRILQEQRQRLIADRAELARRAAQVEEAQKRLDARMTVLT